MNTIKAGVIGLGFIGDAHIEAIRRLGFVEIAAVSDNNYDLACQKASQLGISKAYGDYRELLADEDIQVIHNCTPNHTHFSISQEALAHKKHIMSEKPLAISTTESMALVKLAKNAGVVNAVNFNYIHFPMVQQLRAMVQHGSLGQVHFIHGNYLQDWLLYDTDFNWRLLPEYGGESRAVADIGSHWISTVQSIIQEEVTEVFADLNTVIPVRKRSKNVGETFSTIEHQSQEYDSVEIATEDCASIILKFSNGVRGTFVVSQVSAGRKNHLSIQIEGSQASALWTQENPHTLWIGHRDRPNEILMSDPNLVFPEVRHNIHYPGGHVEGWPDGLKNSMLRFYEFIQDGKLLGTHEPKFHTFEQGHKVMCIVDAILESHHSKSWARVG